MCVCVCVCGMTNTRIKVGIISLQAKQIHTNKDLTTLGPPDRGFIKHSRKNNLKVTGQRS